MKAEVSRQIELVQVLLYLADAQDKTCQCITNKEYCNAITNWFSPYINHPTITITRNLILTNYFFHIRPLKAILNMDLLIKDINNELHNWAVAVRQFTADSNFDVFFDSQAYYYNWILGNVNTCDLDTWIEFIERYFLQSPENFKLIICPIAGNYGFNHEKNGEMTSYVVRCMPYYDESGRPTWQYDFFVKSIAHEYAHCFVNPTVEKHKDRLRVYKTFFVKHKKIPRSYNTDYAVINEYFVRAFQIRFMEQNKTLFPDFNIDDEYDRQSDCFIYIDKFIEALKEFEKSKQSFSEFYTERIDNILLSTGLDNRS